MTKNSIEYPELTERERDIFNLVMQHYTRQPAPIGSRTLAKDCCLSPASIRNIMADLEDLGLLHQPHVSAGRIPTDDGIRYYVDTMINRHNPGDISPEARRRIEKSLSAKTEIEHLLQETSDLLSKITNYAGIVLAPKVISTIYRKIQFIRVSEHRIMVILVTTSGIIHNKIVYVDQEYSQETLEKIANLLNDRFERMTLGEIRTHMVKLFEEEKRKYDSLLDSAARLSELILMLEDFNKDQVYVEGAINIFEHQEFKDLGKLRDLFKVLSERQTLIRLLDRCLSSDGVYIAIGGETEQEDLMDVSIVTSKFRASDNAIGGLGVIGPKRMPYQEVIALVNHISKLLSYLLMNYNNYPETSK